jgi:L-threonylcarbamoyladenylate synthase
VEWLSVDGTDPARESLVRAGDVLRAGGVLIYPTDTLYGLAADPRNASAVERVLGVKGRPEGQALPLIAASAEQATLAARLSGTAWRLAERFWPGPLTLVADACPGLAHGVAGRDGSVALRVADHAVARGIAEALGFPIVSTSANRSGGQPWRSAREAAADLGGDVDLVVDGGPTPGGAPSTIVDARLDPPRLVRAGAVPFELVLEVLTRP